MFLRDEHRLPVTAKSDGRHDGQLLADWMAVLRESATFEIADSFDLIRVWTNIYDSKSITALIFIYMYMMYGYLRFNAQW